MNRYLIYRDEIELVITHFLVGFIWMTLYMMMIQLWFSKIGMTFTEQILDSGSTQLLDNLDEGVIILDEGKRNSILYHNAAAAGLKKSQQDADSAINSESEIDDSPDFTALFE